MNLDASASTLNQAGTLFGSQLIAKRGSLLASLSTLYTLTVRQYLHGRRWLVVGLLFLLPAGLATLVRATAGEKAPPVEIEFVFGFMLIPQALLPLVALIYASGMVQDEQEEQTLTYLLIRPIPKWALYVVKLLATLSFAVLLVAIFTGLTYAAVYVGTDAGMDTVLARYAQAAAIHSLAVVAYCCLFGLISLLTKRTLVVGIVYISVIEGVLANLPFGIRLLTVIYYTRLIAYRTLEFVAPERGVHNIAAEAWQLNTGRDPNLLEHPTTSTCLTVLLVASLVCTVLAAIVCARREFYVKTPEKN